MIHRMVWLNLVFLASVSASLAQDVSLAKVAREERERQKASAEASLPSVVAKDALVQQALRLSGAKGYLYKAVDTAQHLPHAEETPGDPVTEAQHKLLAETFDPTRLMLVMETSGTIKVKEAVLQDVIAWYESPLGNRIAGAEVDASDARAKFKIQTFAKMLKTNPAPATRVSLVRQLMEETHAVDRAIDNTLSIIRAMHSGATVAGANIAPASEEDERAFRLKIASAIDQAILLQGLFAYQSISDDELAQYIEYLRSPSARAFNEAVIVGLNACYADAAMYLGKRLSEMKTPRY